MNIRYVDGFKIRSTTMPNFCYTGTHGQYGCEYVPKGEFWIAKEYRDELRFILNVEKLFQKYMKTKSFKDARTIINREVLEPNGSNGMATLNIHHKVEEWV